MLALKIILAALSGLWFGALVAACFTINKTKNKIAKIVDNSLPESLSNEDKKAVEEVIAKHCKIYKEYAKGAIIRKVFGKKRNKKSGYKSNISYFDIINDVATTLRPNAYKPLLDFSERQLFDFSRSIVRKIKETLDASGIEALKTAKLSTIADVEKLVNAVLGNKVVKGTSRAYSIFLRVLNGLNPYYWLRKTVGAILVRKSIDEIVKYSIKITATETARLFAAR